MRQFNDVLRQVLVSVIYIYALSVLVLTIDQAAAQVLDHEPFFQVKIVRE